jgi:hypothetical protein
METFEKKKIDGSSAVLPGTAVGFCNGSYTNSDGNSYWTLACFHLTQGATITSHGTPNQPIVFVAADLVQETPNLGFAVVQVFYSRYYGDWLPGLRAFMIDAEPGDAVAPGLDFRFCQFYLPADDLHFAAGEPYDNFWWFKFSPDSAMNLSLQDCSLHNGQINFGEPDDGNYPTNFVFGGGSVTWRNNLFENVSINLDPTLYEFGCDDQGLNVDLAFYAYNNLFRGGQWFHLEPIPASAGNWEFRDNLFDRVDIVQGNYPTPAQPLDFDHNAYWPLTTNELAWAWIWYPWWVTNSATLTPVGGNLSGANDLVLDSAPPYASGPFGDYYLSTITPLYQAGSRSAADAGLSQYTTFTNQVKDATNQPVNIGLHYVAANLQPSTGNFQPLDSDGDGVPDYGEVEYGTDPNNPMTDGVTPDAYNAAYDDVDLSGSGLVGRIKKALGLNPLDANNPLTLKQVITGEEPDIATFEVPVSYDVLTNVGALHLLVDGGQGASFQECDNSTNGNCILKWNTTFDSPWQHYLQAELILNGTRRKGSTPDPTILTGVGTLASFYSTNVCQFDPFYSRFDDSGVILYATTPACPDADYTIELKTLSGQHIKTITNSTSSGVISENWDLTDDNRNTVTNDEVDAVFNVTLLDPATATEHLKLYRVFYYSPVDGDFTVAYAWDNDYLANGSMRDAIENGVVDPLMSPDETGGSGNADPYNSTFNRYTWSGDLQGDPGYLASADDAASLVENLKNVETMNFYFNGHGSPITIGDTPDTGGEVSIGSGMVANQLGNNSSVTNAANWGHPYRFVFLDACDTADTRDWAHAFGILDTMTSAQLAYNPWKVQAFVGYIGEPRSPDSDDEWYEMAETYAVFYDLWMNQLNLQECIDTASKTKPFGNSSPITLEFPFGKQFNALQVNWPSTNAPVNNFSLKIYGYPWIKRTGFDPQ